MSPIARQYVNKRNPNKTHCINGHSLKNAYVSKEGRKRCRTCMRVREQKRYREDESFRERKKSNMKSWWAKYGKKTKRAV